MLILEIIILLGAIFIGVKLGGIGIGYAGGIGVVILTLGLGLTPGSIPTDVILIIASVISAISAMQVAGGMEYLVDIAEKILRKNPKYINYLAPLITYTLTLFAGTGHTAFSMIPVTIDVAKSANIKPSVPLSIAVVASQIAITASPISAAVIYMTGVLEPLGMSYLSLLGIWIATTFAGCMLTAFIISTFSNTKLSDSQIFQERLAQHLVEEPQGHTQRIITPQAKLSVLFFALGVLAVVLYACAISKNIALIDPVILPRDGAIISFMLVVASLITIFCKINPSKIPDSSVFKSGMVACICVLGVAWLGDTFVKAHIDEIKTYASDIVSAYPYLLAVGLAFGSMLLYSQASTAKALMPAVIVALGISAEHAEHAYILVASFSAVSALFVLPTYPTLLGAVQMDDTGTTRIGKYIFNHSFIIPGVLAIALSVSLGFILAPLMI
ncbi:C4-dicarboxylate ABC transporter [Helicobacter enhydrae]|uniref:C4-dicarboxylate transporter DcuA n=1 Tax=Helicobacter enhydrae TaxID=222136 RepID=A0A1B1U5L4_9HELI|nr:anaerobic C4-dicarboxylate transporter [Helicobacter enhydrae]ANV98049.1 C4-dicarboxylate ABC transporter [Helicobacter enhydrae]